MAIFGGVSIILLPTEEDKLTATAAPGRVLLTDGHRPPRPPKGQMSYYYSHFR